MKDDASTNGGEAREPGTASLPLDEVGRLVALLTSSGVGEIQVRQGDLEITVKAKPEASPSAAAAPHFSIETESVEVVEPGAGAALAAERNGLHAVRSPVVGTFYRAPAPGEEPFVEVGSRVAEGQTLCIVEAMKLMNEIPSDVSGEVVEVLAENSDGVEYDQPLFRIRPTAGPKG